MLHLQLISSFVWAISKEKVSCQVSSLNSLNQLQRKDKVNTSENLAQLHGMPEGGLTSMALGSLPLDIFFLQFAPTAFWQGQIVPLIVIQYQLNQAKNTSQVDKPGCISTLDWWQESSHRMMDQHAICRHLSKAILIVHVFIIHMTVVHKKCFWMHPLFTGGHSQIN